MFNDPFMLFYVVVGGLVALFAISGLVVFLVKRKQKKRTAYSLTTTGGDRSEFAKRLVHDYENDLD